jgi:hypothetical protein
MRTLVCAFVLVTGACDPFHTEFDDLEKAVYYRAARPGARAEPKPVLRVMNYNVKFGGGRLDFFFDCFGDRVLMQEAEVLRNLERLATKIRQVDPDVLVVQEVDVNSKRAAYVDQMQWLLDHTALDYGVYASQWRADYVPSDGIGAIDSGNGILSKYPLKGAMRIALALRTDQSDLERYFYLKRNILRATTEVGSTKVVVWTSSSICEARTLTRANSAATKNALAKTNNTVAMRPRTELSMSLCQTSLGEGQCGSSSRVATVRWRIIHKLGLRIV